MIPISKPCLSEEEAAAAYDTVLSGWVTQGPNVEKFEKAFANYTGAKYAIAVSSCTTALHLALIAAGVNKADEVICPSLSYIATANSIRYVGARPVFADVCDDYNVDVTDIERKLTTKTKAVMLVHQMGMPANLDEIKALCSARGLALIEDAACAAGSVYKGKRIGSHSELVCFSFHPRKIITTGDGGMITTNRLDYYERLKKLRQHGMSVDDRKRHISTKVIFESYEEVGFNYRLTDIQAAVGVEQLKKLDNIVLRRREIATIYHDYLKDIDWLGLPYDNENTTTNFQSYSILLREGCPIARDTLMQRMLDAKIATRRGIMLAHKEAAYSDVKATGLKRSEYLSANSIIIPLYVPMLERDILRVAETLSRLVKIK